jgi:ATP-binding cassette subfamily C (CFTR/MRP) protein 10
MFRFSSDLSIVDDSLPFILNIFLANIFSVIGPVAVTIYSLPFICLLLFPLAILYFTIQRRYRPASRQLKRIGSVALSPIYAHFSETLAGVTTIRAMDNVTRFRRAGAHNPY